MQSALEMIRAVVKKPDSEPQVLEIESVDQILDGPIEQLELSGIALLFCSKPQDMRSNAFGLSGILVFVRKVRGKIGSLDEDGIESVLELL